MGTVSRWAGRARGTTDRSRGWARCGGFLLLVSGLGCLIAYRLLLGYDPLRWGGPNIGGGALYLVSLAAVPVGAVLVGLNTSRRDWAGRRSRSVAVATWAGYAVTTALTVGLVVVEDVKPGDPAAGLNGQIGVTVSATGDPVLVLEVCRGATDEVEIVGPNRGGARNEVLAHLDAAPPVTSTAQLDLLHPPAGWVVRPGSTLSMADPAELMIVFGTGRRSELRQVAFTAADLTTIEVGTVLYAERSDLRTAPVSRFRSVACE